MWRSAVLAIAVVAPPLHDPAGGPAPLTLELRIFNGLDEVTRHTRVTIHKAGDRTEPVMQVAGGPSGIEVPLPEGIYDVQAIEERDGQVVNIQWANRLVVMPYPDEHGRHLEVLNFKSGFGALQIRAAGDAPLEITLHGAPPSKALIAPLAGRGYMLFVVPAGAYDVSVNRGGPRVTRHTSVEVPRDRTRLWLVPDESSAPPAQSVLLTARLPDSG